MATSISFRPISSQFNKTVSNAALDLVTGLNFSQTDVNAADAAHITVTGNDLRYTYDGTTPTATIGHPLPVGSDILIRGQSLIANLKFIRQGSDGVVNITLMQI
jgi:hypothetical protein